MSKKKPAPKAKNNTDPAIWLQKALKFVPEHGWNPEILPKTAKAVGCDSALAGVVFPRGISDLVQEFHNQATHAMNERIAANRPFKALKVREKVAFGVRARLEAMEKDKEAVRALFGWAAHPLHAGRALRMVWDTCDKIWWQAGDTATDYNHYTKRLLLAQVWQRTLLFWLDDNSRGHSATWHYLDERIAEVLEVGKKLGQAKDMLGLAGTFLKGRFAA